MTSLARGLARVVGSHAVLSGTVAEYTVDATESRFIRAEADAVVLPETAAK